MVYGKTHLFIKQVDMNHRLFICRAIILMSALPGFRAMAQNDTIQKKNTATEILLNLPSFTMYEDNYLITGTTLKESPDKNNSDVKFQISFKQLLFRKPVVENAYAYLTYTQKAFWDVYKESSPFAEINFNPSIGLIRPYTTKKGTIGYYSIRIEHESNGRDSIYSRSWNFVSANWNAEITKKILLGAKVSIPFSSLENNPDLIKYIGYVDIRATYVFKPKKLYADIWVRKGASSDWRGTIQAQVFFKLFRSENQYLMLQWYNGYGESLIDYQRHTNMIRFGIVIKPNYLNVF